MLEKPAISEDIITGALLHEYGLRVDRLEFLPLGADLYTAVFRADAEDGQAYFTKLRLGNFDATSVAVPVFLRAQGISQVMAPLPTQNGALWVRVGDFHGILYPYIEGQNGFARALSERQWVELGAALRKIHATELPPALARQVRRESFTPRWREIVRRLMAGDGSDDLAQDAPAKQLRAFMADHRAEITRLIDRTEALLAHAQAVEARGGKYVLCHTDLHAGNVLLRGEELFIIDWDDPLFAPKERDLMFTGGGIGGAWNRPEEEALFYQGYYGGGEQDPIDWPTLAYYRYARIVEDLALFGEQILTNTKGGEDRAVGTDLFIEAFAPGQVVEIADQTYDRYL